MTWKNRSSFLNNHFFYRQRDIQPRRMMRLWSIEQIFSFQVVHWTIAINPNTIVIVRNIFIICFIIILAEQLPWRIADRSIIIRDTSNHLIRFYKWMIITIKKINPFISAVLYCSKLIPKSTKICFITKYLDLINTFS